MVADPPLRADDLRAVGVLQGEGAEEEVHFVKLPSLSRHLTVLRATKYVIEYHKDFSKDAMTEHSLWLEERLFPSRINRGAIPSG